MEPGKLYIFSGLPAAGKSTLAKALCNKVKAKYLRIDTLEQGLKDICNIKKVEGEGYRISYLLAKDNLILGNDVVADSVNPIELCRKEWNNVASSIGAQFVNIEVICSDKTEHKTRAETREVGVKNLTPTTWDQIINREYHPWQEQVVQIDTAGKSINQCSAELLARLEIK